MSDDILYTNKEMLQACRNAEEGLSGSNALVSGDDAETVQEILGGYGVWSRDLEIELLRHFDKLRLEMLANNCEHTICDARNEVVKAGYVCTKCGALFAAADH